MQTKAIMKLHSIVTVTAITLLLTQHMVVLHKKVLLQLIGQLDMKLTLVATIFFMTETMCVNSPPETVPRQIVLLLVTPAAVSYTEVLYHFYPEVTQ